MTKRHKRSTKSNGSLLKMSVAKSAKQGQVARATHN
jgi:hypothetical protein